MPEIVVTDGFIVSCMTCHQQIGTECDTHAEAMREARIHLSKGGDKDHTGHTMAITPAELVRLKA